MSNRALLTVFMLVLGILICSRESLGQHAKFVDSMLGVDGGGNTFPGATLPFGMLKAGPDTGGNNANSGWTAQFSINGFSGFIWPLHRDATWKANLDPLPSGSWGSDSYYEGHSWTYSTYVPQEVAGLIHATGGDTQFVKRRDAFFDLPNRYDVGNERGFLAPCLYIWVKRPASTQSHIRSILAKSYHAGMKGLPGNDDSGAMSSWYAFGKMGFYPNAAQDVYLMDSPAYRRTSISLANGRKFVIEAVGDVAVNPYIASAIWNGHPYRRAWFTHKQLMLGGTLVLTMSANPTDPGADVPPSSLSDDNRK